MPRKEVSTMSQRHEFIRFTHCAAAGPAGLADHERGQ